MAFQVSPAIPVTGPLEYVGHRPPKRPKECLPHIADVLRETAAEIGLNRPTAAQVSHALGEYNLFSPDELAALEKEMPL
ncbi:unnamed protein product [Gemmata massiliana]|uniref:Uncharacterized protein n=1 Tax=Gemmata massiliana TaxID=1210884 RepID=A0A6P2CZA2_9BACT|nr:hypothetical protein [Gemmata massiliana]VTR92482.1 unnamed protein product [Gemmata massiliana]